MKKKLVLGSQRALQFGGQAILDRNPKMFNCAASYVDRPRFFQEVMHMLLCGVGTGFSVQIHHVNKLPEISKPTGKKLTVQIEDSIEGWADSVGKLLSSYFVTNQTFPECYNKTIEFDYSLIRPKGSIIKSSGAQAPGPDGLKNAHEKVRELLEIVIKKGQKKLKPINAYDIIMHLSDAVLSGGIRRSATLSTFSIEDEEMMKAKTGDWFIKNPQRGRSNNSVVLLKEKTSFKDFENIIQNVKQFGEPGFIWTDSLESLFNPCQPKWAKVLTKKGIREFKDINEGDYIWSKEGWTKVLKKWSTGINKVFKYQTTSNIFYGTENHRILSNGEKIKIKNAESIDSLVGHYQQQISSIPEIVMDGLVFADGTVHKASNNKVLLCIGENDKNYFNSEISNLIIEHRKGINEHAYNIKTSIKYQELPKTYERKIPDRYIYGDKKEVASFLKGLYSANGSICGNRITLKSTSKSVIEDVQLMLNSIGISSYYTTNKEKINKFRNGFYNMKKSYDLNISSDRNKFYNMIGFLHDYKMDKLKKVIEKTKHTQRKDNWKIVSKELISEEETFDITVDNKTHTYWTQGCDVSNCVEVNLFGYNQDGDSGWETCNLSTINVKKAKTKEDFLKMCEYASILGTLQAGYTKFDYLGKVSEDIIKREALLGVSMTGMMDAPEIAFDPELQREGAKIIKSVNKKLAKKLNINQSARLNVLKPEGTSSCILGTSSGIHPQHSKRYFRRVQANKMEEPLKYFKSINPLAVEESVWSANNTDDIITFLCEVPPNARTKVNTSAIQLLDYVKLTQKNWIAHGKNESLCVEPWLTHNVSLTCNVRENEWQEVTNYIYKNRKHFAGISLLPMDGDKDYPQAPFTTVYTAEEIVKEYGSGALLASGLIVDGLRAWDDDLWACCDCILDRGEDLTLPKFSSKKEENRWKRQNNYEDKIDWIRRGKQFSKRYFDNDIRKMTYCLKDVYNLKKWEDLKREYKEVPWESFHEKTDNTKVSETVACAGGSCDIF